MNGNGLTEICQVLVVLKKKSMDEQKNYTFILWTS
jgi:hypothetical protein